MYLKEVILILFLHHHPAFSSKSERDLYKKLKDDYSPLERPAANCSEPVTVYLRVVLQQLLSLDAKTQFLTINAWLKYTWTDRSLRWTPADYGGIGDVRFPAGRLWKPDVFLFNSVDPAFDSAYPVNMVVYADGTVNWIPPGIFQLQCKIDITHFPFDDQICHLKFGSWTYDGGKVDLRVDAEGGFDMSEYMTNGEFYLAETHANRSVKCCSDASYPILKFYLHLRRRTLYYTFNFIIPNLEITIMTILGFWLPVEAYEKITLQVTILLSICVYLNMVASMSPATSEAVPLLGVFFSCCLVLVSASIVFTVVVLNLHFRSPDTHSAMSPWTERILCHWLPALLGIKRPGFEPAHLCWCGEDEAPDANRITCSTVNKRQSNETESSMVEVLSNNASDGCSGASLAEQMASTVHTLQTANTFMSAGIAVHVELLARVCKQLDFITERLRDEDGYQREVAQWRFAAYVVDALCLWLFAGAVAASVLYLALAAPYLHM